MTAQNESIKEVAALLLKSKKNIAFTGAGISVESGIPPFRGEGGIWNKYDPEVLELDYFIRNPKKSWPFIKEMFYDFFKDKEPNAAHRTLAIWEKKGLLSGVITQNIDNLHQQAGTQNALDFHGNAQRIVCISCGFTSDSPDAILTQLPPRCPECGNLLKPDFVFFGEGIPREAYSRSMEWVETAEIMLIIGTSGEVSPANQLPVIAKRNGATIVEINPMPSSYTNSVTNFYLPGKAGEILLSIHQIIAEN